jgi:hypothetical protein
MQMEFVARALVKDILIWCTNEEGNIGFIPHAYGQSPLAELHLQEAVFLHYDARGGWLYQVLIPVDPDDTSSSTSSHDDSLPGSPSLMPQSRRSDSDSGSDQILPKSRLVSEARASDITSTPRITELSHLNADERI